jgi:alkanesulfonate monooxygenase SsuD/methylene tetrahydromethanopterin reductase-like flavin-dependent oxidoreductase (luciferase family)
MQCICVTRGSKTSSLAMAARRRAGASRCISPQRVRAPSSTPARWRTACCSTCACRRRFVAVYLSLFPNVARETGLEPTFVEELRSAFSAGGVERAAPRVSDEVVDLLTAAGTVEDCRRRLEEYRAAGVQLAVLAPIEGSLELAIESLH